MRQRVRALQAGCRDHAAGTRGVLVSIAEEPGPCPQCGGPMGVRKTVRRHGSTLEHGAFEARETVHICKADCRWANEQAVTRRAQELARCIPPRATVGYDVMVRVGLERYLHHRQREEIRAALQEEEGITLSSGEISVLSTRFLDYLKALHEACAPSLRQALEQDGGWPLHTDATGEDGRGTLLAAVAGWRRWVLGAWKIPTERADAILPHLREVVTRFGTPCAVVRDLGRAMILSVQGLIGELDGNVRELSCHLHFLRDVGTDLLKPSHGELRTLFRRSKVQPALRRLARDLGRKLGKHLNHGRASLEAWRDDQAAPHVIPQGKAGLAVVRGLTQWVLDYRADAPPGGFPFARPYLDFYDRCCRARRAADAFLRHPPADRKVCRAIGRLVWALDRITADQQAATVAATLRKRALLFDELRDTLRLAGTSSPPASQPSSQTPALPEDASRELDDIQAAFDRWGNELRERRPDRGPAQDTRQAIDTILDHIHRHGATLWGHAIPLPAEAGGGVRLVARTNNCEEHLFHEDKHGERRRSGRKILTHDLETRPAEALLVHNLKRPDYLRIVCGGDLNNLPAAFADLDARRAREERNNPPAASSPPPETELTVVSASLPAADRLIVRTTAMNRRVQRAAHSRAPRVTPTA